MATTNPPTPSSPRGAFFGRFKWAKWARKHRVLLGLVVVVVLVGAYNREWIWGQVWISVGHSCGIVYAGIAEIGPATTCFSQAYAACRPATLEYENSFGDGADDDLYIIEPAPIFGGCSLAIRGTTYQAWGTYTGMNRCNGMENVDGKLHFWGCGSSQDAWWIPYPPQK